MMNKVKPISPSEVAQAKGEVFPPAVIQVFNREIARGYVNGHSRVFQAPIVAAIMSTLDCHRDHVYRSGWLNIEAMYEAEGWRVTYHKASYDESGDSYWDFERARK